MFRIGLSSLTFLLLPACLLSQSSWLDDVRITIDSPEKFSKPKTVVCFYALPNGNSTEWTMGKQMQAGDDWHYDIQHISAQTAFIREHWKQVNFVVIYLENQMKSWPAWKSRHQDYRSKLPALIDSLSSSIKGKQKEIYLNGHSGGGSLIFGYLDGVAAIPSSVKRISFIDSDYGYDSSYYPKLRDWLNKKGNVLTVFAYNDSVALYNGKPVVSATGGTWYRSRLMLSHLQNDWQFHFRETDSMLIHISRDNNIHFYLKKNLNRGIYHTQQVELNGFIHSVFSGTAKESKYYFYYGSRAYENLIMAGREDDKTERTR